MSSAEPADVAEDARRPWRKRLVQGLYLFLATAILLEGLVRAVEWVRGPLVVRRNPAFAWLIADPLVGHVNAATAAVPQLRFDERGYRVPDRSPANAKGRVLCLGDSGTFGFLRTPGDEVSLDSDWPRILSEALEQAGLPMRVDNAAAIGYTSWHGRKVLERDTAPVDVVAIRFAWNDGSAGDVRPYDKRWRRWLCCSAVGRNVLLALESDANADRMKLGPALSVEEFKACLRSLVSAARARDALPILIDYPISTAPLRPDTEIGLKVTHPWSNAPDEVFAHHARYREAIAAVARETGAAFVAPDMDDSCFSPLDVVHPNLEGARRTAEAVARVIEARWKPNRP